jgi:hypothetical protein
MLGFNPYTYQPLMQSYYLGRPMPDTLQKAAAANPEAARHIVSVWQFMTWLNESFPQLYAQLAPAVTDAEKVVISKAISPRASGGGAGLGALVEDAAGNVFDDGRSSSGVLSEWGKTISDMAQKYLVYDQQRKLIDLNIKRAEQGLAPIDASNYGAGVSVGLSPQTQNLAYMALAGLVIVGLIGALKGGRK